MNNYCAMMVLFVVSGYCLSIEGNECMKKNPKELSRYRSKRNFSRTSEPRGKAKSPNDDNLFVVQHHEASHDHYDLRLAINGVLVSWAVPKGIPGSIGVKRLAIQTEDHPMEYARFEGTIPEGNYGAGTVMVWDIGTYDNQKEQYGESIHKSYKKGRIELVFHGKKLQGPYALIRTQRGDNQWLLFKQEGKAPTKAVAKRLISRSALTGRTMKEIAAESEPVDPVKVGKRSIEITHPDRVLFPRDGYTKHDIADYYAWVAPLMYPRCKNRLIVMQRFPDGIDHEGFYFKDAPDYYPAWITRKKIAKETGGYTHYVVDTDPATMVYLANQGCITPHIWLSTADNPNKPDKIIFDLDPSGRSFKKVIRAAQLLRELLEEHGLKPFVMTTGSRGLHVVVPIKQEYSFDEVRAVAKSIASELVDRYPSIVTISVRKSSRGTKVFVDYLRNAFGQTGVAPYALRVLDGAPIAMPIGWDELDDPSLHPQYYTLSNIKQLTAVRSDPWKSFNRSARSIRHLID